MDGGDGWMGGGDGCAVVDSCDLCRADQTPPASRRAMGAVPNDSPEVPRGRKEARPARPHTRVSLGRSLGVSPAAVKIALP